MSLITLSLNGDLFLFLFFILYLLVVICSAVFISFMCSLLSAQHTTQNQREPQLFSPKLAEQGQNPPPLPPPFASYISKSFKVSPDDVL